MRSRPAALLAIFVAACGLDRAGLGENAPSDDAIADASIDDTSVDTGEADTGGATDASDETKRTDASDADDADGPDVDPCHDEARDGDESDIDCGGSCAPCTAGHRCKIADDCVGALVCGSDELCGAPTSCKELHAAKPSAPSGAYAFATTGNAYCDMSTDGGGWTLVLAYNHAANSNPAVAPGTPPLDPSTGFSHLSNAQMLALPPFDAVLFYCQTSMHPRRMHFESRDPGVVAWIRGTVGAKNADAMWKTFTTLADHTANLPGTTDSTPGTPFDPALDLRMTEFPFFDYGASHWAIAGRGARWECDDWAGSGAYATQHLVWVR